MSGTTVLSGPQAGASKTENVQPAWCHLPVTADEMAAISHVSLTPLVTALVRLPFSAVAFGNGDPALSTQSATVTPGPPHPAPSDHQTSGKWQMTWHQERDLVSLLGTTS